MDAIHSLLTLIDQLLGPNGCPWDQKQTLDSSRTYILEEAAELIDAINTKDREEIQEELGDLLFVVLFVARLAEKEQVTTLSKGAASVAEKLIRRHPHVFGDAKQLTPDEVVTQWHEIKKREKKPPSNPLDKIPKSLPSLSRAAELIKACQKQKIDYSLPKEKNHEEKIGLELFALVQKALKADVDPELALRNVVAQVDDSVGRHPRF
jgi:tetrapyrrole methylase family protein/MazG family protein